MAGRKGGGQKQVRGDEELLQASEKTAGHRGKRGACQEEGNRVSRVAEECKREGKKW